MNPNYDLFISWTGSYGKELAQCIKGTLDQVTSNNERSFKTFVSSVSIELGKKWRDELHDALSDSHFGLIIVTQDIIHSDWIAHEASTLSNRNRLWFLLADCPAALLPSPLHEYQLGEFNNESITHIFKKFTEK